MIKRNEMLSENARKAEVKAEKEREKYFVMAIMFGLIGVISLIHGITGIYFYFIQ